MMETRHCFKEQVHEPHSWAEGLSPKVQWCFGQGFDGDGYVHKEPPQTNILDLQVAHCEVEMEHPAHMYRGDPGLEWCTGKEMVLIEEPLEAEGNVDETDALLATRKEVYGDRPTQMRNTALVWTGLFYDAIVKAGKFEPWMIPLFFSSYKMIRTTVTPDYGDNTNDVKGWFRMFEEQMEADGTPIIDALTVTEYAEKKERYRVPASPFAAGRVSKTTTFEPRLLLDQSEGRMIDDYMRKVNAKPSGNPYGNVEDERTPRRCWIVTEHHEHGWSVKGVGEYYCNGQ